MKWLVWKDYRLSRPVLVTVLLLWLGPQLFGLIIAAHESETPIELQHLGGGMVGASMFTIVLSQFTLAIIGGYIIACERESRSAEFLAYLPVSRFRILTSKMAPACCVRAQATLSHFAPSR